MQSKDLYWSVLASAVIAGFGVIGGVLLARSLGPDLRGQVAALIVWIGILSTLGEFGIGFAVMYYVGRDRSRASMLFTQSILSALVAGVCIWTVASLALPKFVQLPAISAMTRCLALSSVIFTLLAGHISMTLLGLGFLKSYYVVRIVGGAIYSAGVAILYFGNQKTPDLFVIAFWFSHLGSATMALCLAIGPAKLRWEANFSGFKQILSYGLKTQVAAISAQANLRLDQIVISMFLPHRDLGLYAVAVAVSQSPSPLYSGLTSAMTPRVLSASKTGAGARVGLWTVLIGALFGTALGALLWIASPRIVQVVFGTPFAEAAPIARLLILASVFQGLNQMLGAVLRALGKPEDPAKAEIVGLALTAALLALLLPTQGIQGAAVTSLSAYAIIALIELKYVIGEVRRR